MTFNIKQKAIFLGISADEVTDVSNLEQLGIVERYDRNCLAIEKLLSVMILLLSVMILKEQALQGLSLTH